MRGGQRIPYASWKRPLVQEHGDHGMTRKDLDVFCPHGPAGTPGHPPPGMTNRRSSPVINLAIPPKPNLAISPKNISLDKNFLDESIDSAIVKIIYNNYGTVLPQNFTVGVTHSINGIVKDTLSFRRLLPMMSDSIIFSIPVKGFVGSHQIEDRKST